MSAAGPLLVGVAGLLVVQRLVELGLSRRNERELLRRGATRARPDGLGPLIAVHAALLVALPLEGAAAPWAGLGAHTWILVTVAAAASILRYWAAYTLGPYYTVRVLRTPRVALVRRGPYRWTRHPIYFAVAIEVFAYPLAFGAVATSLTLGAVNLGALVHRVRLEERHLAAA